MGTHLATRVAIRPCKAGQGCKVGYIPFEHEAANLFFRLVSSRYERASLSVTSTSSSAAGAKSSAMAL